MALFIYGVWGSPTPNNPNWVEVMIAILLVFAIGFKPLYQTIRIRPFEKTQRWRTITQFFFLWGLFVPLSIGLLKASPLDTIFRDLVGFIFLCFPLFGEPARLLRLAEIGALKELRRQDHLRAVFRRRANELFDGLDVRRHIVAKGGLEDGDANLSGHERSLSLLSARPAAARA